MARMRIRDIKKAKNLAFISREKMVSCLGAGITEGRGHFCGVVFRFNGEPSSKNDSILHRCKCYIALLVSKRRSLRLGAVL